MCRLWRACYTCAIESQDCARTRRNLRRDAQRDSRAMVPLGGRAPQCAELSARPNLGDCMGRKTRQSRMSLLCCAFLLSAGAALGQTQTQGAITGTVEDATGAVV